MGVASNYWTRVRLSLAGNCELEEMPAARIFFHQQFPQLAEQDTITDEPIQAHLIALINAADDRASPNDRHQADVCLRCFISHQTAQVCISLEAQFGQHYGFRRQDLLPLVLDDDCQRSQPAYVSLASQILQSFNPKSGSLATWTIRLTRQHRDLNAFLLERGLYLVSDWAILNDTKPDRLRRVLTEFYRLTLAEVEQACALLESYRAVYLPDRLKQRHRGPCLPPTEEQLQRISQLLQQKTGKLIAPVALLSQLQALAKRLRQYRIYVRGGPLPTQSMDAPETSALTEQLSIEPAEDLEDQEDQQQEFLVSYRHEFLACLDAALEHVVRDRQQKSKTSEQADQLLRALQLFHCQRLSMTEIAAKVGLNSQETVSRRLRLKELRAAVRRHMLQRLRDFVVDSTKRYRSRPLEQLDDQIEAALDEQIDALLQEEARQSKTPKEYLSGSMFARRLCEYLDRIIIPHTRSC